MHELSIANEVIRIVEYEMARRRLDCLVEIVLRVGALSGVNPDALAFGFEAGSCGTSLEGCRLKIEWLPVQGVCRDCGSAFECGEYVFICPCCGSQNLDMTQGEELEIAHLVTCDSNQNQGPPGASNPAGADYEQEHHN